MGRFVGQSPLEAQQIAERIVRYRGDFRAFATEQLRIGGKRIEFWPCQVPLVESIERQFEQQGFARCVWLKARQTGSSTLAQCFVAWRTMLWPNVNAIVIADESERARNLFEICRCFYDDMDPDVRPAGRYVTKREVVFANPSHATRMSDPGLRSRVVIDSANKKSIGIGAAWTVEHLSECARYRDPRFVIDGLIPAVHRVPGTIVIMESSAEMAGTWWRDWCEAAQRGTIGFEFSFVPWILHPEYYVCPVCKKSYPDFCRDPQHVRAEIDLFADERRIMVEFGLKPGHVIWMRAKLAEMANDWDLFRQSYPLTPEDAWVTPGVQVFPLEILRRMKEQLRPPKRRCDIFPGPRVLDSPQGRLMIWKEPESTKAYDIGVDVASGVGKDDDIDDSYRDYSVACVIERGSNEQVAELVSRELDAFELSETLYWLGKYYQTAQLAVEVNGIGSATNAHLGKLGYDGLYLWRYRNELAPRYTNKTGWETNPRTKPWLVGFAQHEVINSRVVIRSEALYREMETFIMKGPREWGAVAKHKDDRVMAWMIALLVSDDECFERYYGLQKTMEQSRTSDDGKSVEGVAKRPREWECDPMWFKPKRDDDWGPWD